MGVDAADKKYLCNCCKDEEKGVEQIYSCKKCKKNLCIGCITNVKVGEIIPHDGDKNIDFKYCPFCSGKVDRISTKTRPDYSRVQKESNIGKKVEVCFNYDRTIVTAGTIVQDDTEPPFVTRIKLMDGRYILDSECQYRIIS
ncbi:hypothetical protein [Anaerosinus massiliensis]|uniref:hypothetical protein n=1 Tax=Massilibacillus massiliensis TaxID=1806837 RepID=UPI000DA619DD|nr:hypothetical protein [Massilibacillus massiliensis]